MITFNYKIYDKANTFKKVINPSLIQSDIQFTAQKNGGQGDLSITIKGIDTTIKHSDIVRVFYSSDIVKNRLIYTGFIDEITNLIDNGESMEISAIGMASYLLKVIFQSGGLRTFTLNKTASAIITDIVNYITTINPLITAGTIESTVGNVNIEFDNTYCLKSLEKVIEITPNHYFYIDENCKINFKLKVETPNYYATFQKDLQSYESQEVAKIYNKLYLTYTGGSKPYEDATSIATYGISEKFENKTDIKDVTTADEYAVKFFEENANPQRSRKMQINREFKGYKNEIILMGNTEILWGNETLTFESEGKTVYGYEIIQPGEYIKILNFKQEIIGQIEKLDFRKDYINLTLNKNFNLISLIKE